MRVTIVVLIAGAGPAGLALAIELGMRGVACIVIEPQHPVPLADYWHSDAFKSPRAKLTNMRTMEHLRRWGIADTLRAAAPLPQSFPQRIIFTTRLNARHELARFDDAFGHDGAEGTSPEGPQQCPQFVLESVLRDRARSLAACDLRFGERLASFEQQADGVVATIERTDGTLYTIDAEILAGCDGSHSVVRHGLGITMVGDHAISASLSVVFRSPDLAAAIAHPPAIHYWLVNGDAPAICGPLGNGLWWIMFTAGNFGTTPPPLEEITRLMHAAVGVPIAFDVIDASPWSAHRLAATQYRDRRVFLLGDAAHLHPPTGGHGMNMGIGDAVDLGWKLAAVFEGWGGPELLDSYEAERRPIHERTIASAVNNWAFVANSFADCDLESDGAVADANRLRMKAEIRAAKLPEFRSPGLVLGASYAHSPIVAASEAGDVATESVITYTQSAAPGSRAPHRWLVDGTSLYDHFGPGFTLLQFGSTPPSTEAFEEAARARGIPLRLVRRADDGLAELYAAPLALIRPDQHVAWRGDAVPIAIDELIDRVCGGAVIGLLAEPVATSV